jgi:hypothetical protein
MNSLQGYAFTATRVSVALVFPANGFPVNGLGIIPQALAARALADH